MDSWAGAPSKCRYEHGDPSCGRRSHGATHSAAKSIRRRCNELEKIEAPAELVCSNGPGSALHRFEMPLPEPRSTLELLRNYRARRDADSLDRLFRACYPMVLGLVEVRLRRRLRGNREAEDFVQDSLLEVLRGLKHFVPRSKGAFRSWLARIVENNLRDHERHARAAKRDGARVVRFSELPGASLRRLIDGRPPPGAELGASELEARIERAMKELDEPYREVLILRRLCGFSHDQIATRMGYATASSARSLYTRALKRLRSQLVRSAAAVERPRVSRRAKKKA